MLSTWSCLTDLGSVTKSWTRSLALKGRFYETNHYYGFEVLIAAIPHVFVGSMMWVQMAMAVSVVVRASQKTEWMMDVGVVLKMMAVKKP